MEFLSFIVEGRTFKDVGNVQGESRSQTSQDRGNRFDRIWECVRRVWPMRSLVRIISRCRESWFEEGHSKGWGLKFTNLFVDFLFFQFFDQWEMIILRLLRERSVFVGSSREGIRE